MAASTFQKYSAFQEHTDCILRNLGKFSEKHRRLVSFNKVSDLQTNNLTQKDSTVDVFLCKTFSDSYIRKPVNSYFWIMMLKHSYAVIQRCFVKNVFSKIALRPATLSKKSLWHRCFPVNFAKFLWRPYLQNTARRLFLF